MDFREYPYDVKTASLSPLWLFLIGDGCSNLPDGVLLPVGKVVCFYSCLRVLALGSIVNLVNLVGELLLSLWLEMQPAL